MEILIKILIAIIALLHLYFLYFEMFAWETIGKKTFGKRREGFYAETKMLVANQGLYNGFLVAGLVWSFFINDVEWSRNVALFFLSCVAVAGIYGAATASKKILFIQAVPAIITIALILLT